MEGEKFFLLDSRAGLLALENDGILNTDDNGKYILFVGSLKECCRYANNGDMGEMNVVSNDKFEILWQLNNEHGHWIPRMHSHG